MGVYILYNIWFMMFMSAQGYGIEMNIIYQDYQSAMRIEKNGYDSCMGKSRHKHIKYFFVKNRIDKGNMKVEYCPKYSTLADFFIKPLVVEMFRKLRSFITRYTSILS